MSKGNCLGGHIAQVNKESWDRYYSEIEPRITKTLRGFIVRCAEYSKKFIEGKYLSSNDDRFLEITENMFFGFLDKKIQPPFQTDPHERTERNLIEQQSAVIMVKAMTKKAKEIDQKTYVAVVKPNRRGFKQASPAVFVMNRYGPWALDMVPYTPEKHEAVVLYVQVGEKEVQKTRKKNKDTKSKWSELLTKYQVVPANRLNTLENLEGFDNWEYHVLRMELGLDPKKIQAWRPAIKWLTNGGWEKVFFKNMDLTKSLTDINFRGWASMDSGYDIISEGDVEETKKFQEKIIG